MPALRIYVSVGCASCRTALVLADAVRHARPGRPVHIIDLADHPGESLPSGVVGTPTYLRGDTVISMGNPDLAELLARLDGAQGTVE